jgi:hypothetical protein
MEDWRCCLKVAGAALLSGIMSKRRYPSTAWIAALVGGALALQQSPFIIRGDYLRHVVWKSTSPDGRYRLEVRRQVTFPAVLDPSGWTYFAVVDIKTGREGARTVVRLPQYYDLQKPTVEWTPQAVEVLNFDQHRPGAVRLLLTD